MLNKFKPDKSHSHSTFNKKLKTNELTLTKLEPLVNEVINLKASNSINRDVNALNEFKQTPVNKPPDTTAKRNSKIFKITKAILPNLVNIFLMNRATTAI